MSQAKEKVKLKLEVKGSPCFKFEFKGRLDEALNLAADALHAVQKRVVEMETAL